MAGSSLFFSLMSALVKDLSAAGIPSQEIVFFRASINCVIAALWMKAAGETFFPPMKRLLVVRGLAGFLAVTCLFYTLGKLPLPVASLLNWSSPLWVILFSWMLIGERTGRKTIIWVMVSLVGLILLLDPDWANFQTAFPLGVVGIGILGSAAAGAAYVAVRAATRRVGTNGIIFYFTFTATLLSLPSLFFQGGFAAPDGLSTYRLIGMGLFATAGQYMMTEAYRYAPAGIVSTMNLLNVVWGSVLGLWLFGESLHGVQWVGMSFLAIGIAQVTLSTGKRKPA